MLMCLSLDTGKVHQTETAGAEPHIEPPEYVFSVTSLKMLNELKPETKGK